MDLELHPDAHREFIEAAADYDGRVPSLGRRFIDEFERLTCVLGMTQFSHALI